jgi:hypothetical protein
MPGLRVVIAPSRTISAAGNAGSMSPVIVIGSASENGEIHFSR